MVTFIVGLVIGVAGGYGFRGKENKALKAAKELAEKELAALKAKL